MGNELGKDQLTSKADWRAKKGMDEFVLFAFLLFTANKSNSPGRFFVEITVRQSTFLLFDL